MSSSFASAAVVVMRMLCKVWRLSWVSAAYLPYDRHFVILSSSDASSFVHRCVEIALGLAVLLNSASRRSPAACLWLSGAFSSLGTGGPLGCIGGCGGGNGFCG